MTRCGRCRNCDFLRRWGALWAGYNLWVGMIGMSGMVLVGHDLFLGGLYETRCDAVMTGRSVVDYDVLIVNCVR